MPQQKESVVIIPSGKLPAVPDLDYDDYENIYNEDGTIKAKIIPWEDWKKIALFMIEVEENATALDQNPK